MRRLVQGPDTRWMVLLGVLWLGAALSHAGIPEEDRITSPLPAPPRQPNRQALDNREHVTPSPMIPANAWNVALGKTVTTSDPANVIIGRLEQVTDGERNGGDASIVELGPGLQYVQIDLGEPTRIYAIHLWHDFCGRFVFQDVIVITADDPEMTVNPRVVYNNDHDGSSGLKHLEPGNDYHYVDTNRGYTIRVPAVVGRHVRLYSNDSVQGTMSRYTEVAVYGVPTREKPDETMIPLQPQLPRCAVICILQLGSLKNVDNLEPHPPLDYFGRPDQFSEPTPPPRPSRE